MRRTRFFFILLTALLVAPAIAGADGATETSCLTATAGGDVAAGTAALSELAASAPASTSATDSVASTLRLEAVPGGRTILADAARYRNDCGRTVDIELVPLAADGDWRLATADLRLSTVADPVGPPLADRPDWSAGRLRAGATGFLGSSGLVRLDAGDEVRLGVIISADARFDGDVRLRWAVQVANDAEPADPTCAERLSLSGQESKISSPTTSPGGSCIEVNNTATPAPASRTVVSEVPSTA